MTLKRLILLVLAVALVAAPIAESATFSDSPSAGAAKKKKGKCKKKGKKGKKGKKCKKKGGGGGSGPGGLPGKPVNPDPSDPDDPPGSLVLSGMSLDENPLLAGSSGEGQVTISGPAPAGGQPVTLGSALPGRASVPDSVHIAAGQTSANFDITTTAGPNETVTLTSAIESSVRTADLDIVEEESVHALALDYQCFPDDNLTNFGNSVVSLDVRAPDDVSVALSSDGPGFLDVPASVTVLENSFSGVFSVDTFAMTTTPVTVTATYDGEQVTDSATVRDNLSPEPVPSSLGLQPASVVVGDPSTGTVNLDCEAPPGGILVTLGSDHPNAHVPATVLVPEGELGATFPITTDLSGTPGQAHITAESLGSGVPAIQATLTLRAIGT